jgi:hypothetical protein
MTRSRISPLRLVEDILHNRMMQREQEMHRTHKRSDTARVLIEIETLQWVLSKSLSEDDNRGVSGTTRKK